ncbi:MAG: hypothetical protein ACK5C0_00450 [Candidatus Kapaibacterium sp.]|jgi:hypothetical protein
MSNIKEYCSVLDDFQKGRPLYEHLNKGLDKKTIEYTIMTAYNLDYPIDPHIVELYAWHNGISKEFLSRENVTNGDLWFFDMISLLSLEDSMELGRMLTNDFLSREPDEPRYFYNDPENILSLFTSRTGIHHFVFLDDYSQKGYTPVWIQDSPLYINRPNDDFSDYMQIFDSIETMFLTFFTAITQKVIRVDGDINRIEYDKIASALNPQSEYWKYNQCLY